MRKSNPTYTEEFKRQLVALHESGRSVNELHVEYKVSKTALRNWISELRNSGQFGIESNLSESEQELRSLRKENKHLKMENDILKQAALILGRRDV